MAEPFIGEIIVFAGTFAPRGYADCDGQLLQINQNQALFSLLGTRYGGDGRTTFGLPDLRGRAAMHQGSGPGLTPRALGARTGSEAVALTPAQMPVHSHAPRASTVEATDASPSAAGVLVLADGETALYGTAVPTTLMSAEAIGDVGGNAAHGNMMPFQTVRYCISLSGLFPSRN